jgi:hypothetical protein
VPVQAIIDNARDGFTAEQIATDIFALPVDVMRRILRDLYSANVLLTRYPASSWSRASHRTGRRSPIREWLHRVENPGSSRVSENGSVEPYCLLIIGSRGRA